MSKSIRRLSVSLGLVIVAVMFASLFAPSTSASAAALPAGIPETGTAATVHRVIDGDQVYIDRGDGTLQHVLLAGIDAPNEGECFYEEAKAKLAELLPVGATVYLEASGTVDKEDGLPVRYIWVPGVSGQKAKLVNTKMVREGRAGFNNSLDTPAYYGNLQGAQATAQSKDAGVWGACSSLHEAISPPVDSSFVLGAAAAANEALARAFSGSDNYPDWIAAQTGIVTSTVGQLGILMTTFTADSLYDPAWVSSVNALAEVWNTAYNNALATTPPAEYTAAHALWIEAMQHYANAANYLTTGLANFDATGISSAANELTMGSLLIVQVSDAVAASN